MSTEYVKVLSIDGGGIRGLIPAVVLEKLELSLQRPLAKVFDLIAGTSTGGILALGLAANNQAGEPKYSATELIKLYEVQGPKIFDSSWWYKLLALGNLRAAKFDNAGIDKVLEEYFGDLKLSQASTNILVTAYEIERRQSWFFKSYKAKEDPTRDFSMQEVARSTSAAPTFFPPNKIDTNTSQDYFALVDGGVFANNPAMCAYVEAKKLYPDKKIILVSLGTGNQVKSIPYNNAKYWGLAKWARPILDVVFDGIDDSVDYHLNKLIEGGQDKYFRLQIRLPEGSESIDNVSVDNLRNLKLIGEELINLETVKIREIIANLQ